MKRLVIAVIVACLSAGPAGAASRRPVLLGTDAAGDSPPGLDLTYLSAAADRKLLEIRIGIAGMTPGTGGYPALPGIEWTFTVGGRTFIAEAVAGTPNPDFYLFELRKGTFKQLKSPTGTYNPADGYTKILVPLKAIGAKRGSRISGVGKRGTEDVDAHVHLGATTHYPDKMATKRDIRVP
jgi:hypothetical protein